MAINSFKFCGTNDDLNWLLNNLTLTAIVGDDLARYDTPGMPLILDFLFEYRGVEHEIDVEIDFLPKGKEFPIELVVINYREPSYEKAGLFTYAEFAHGLHAAFMKQSEGDSLLRERARKLIQKYDLEKYADM